MTSDDILQRFDGLTVWARGDQRAPHKPLLILYALGQWQQGESEIPYMSAEEPLTELLREFGPPRRSDHPEEPYWRLQNDGVWLVQSPAELQHKKGHTIPRVTDLRATGVRAGFTADVQDALRADPRLIAQIATRVLERHFPASLHPDILNAVGLSLLLETPAAQKRDSQFRQKVLTAYERRCAVCGFDVRLGSTTVALDAAHIRWHQAGGPAEESNGLALCVLHHKLFDLGAFTLDKNGHLLVSDQAVGTTGFEEKLLRFHGQRIRSPQRPEHSPATEHLDWHLREVFKGAARFRPEEAG